MLKLSKYLSLILVLGLALAAAIVTLRFTPKDYVGQDIHNDEVIGVLRSLRPSDWTVSDIPLGQTELDHREISRVLKFDDAVQLQFNRGSDQFTVYVAYWKPGANSMRTVGAHTPDTCWVLSGWQMTERKNNYQGSGAAPATRLGEYRKFEQKGSIQHVAFWYTINQVAVPIWRNGFPKPSFLWDVMWRDPGFLAGSQYFVRISSPRPLDELWNEKVMQEILGVLRPIGIGRQQE